MSPIEITDTADPTAHNLYHYRMFPDVRPPLVATQGSACFDLYVHLSTDRVITSKTSHHAMYNKPEHKTERIGGFESTGNK